MFHNYRDAHKISDASIIAANDDQNNQEISQASGPNDINNNEEENEEEKLPQNVVDSTNYLAELEEPNTESKAELTFTKPQLLQSSHLHHEFPIPINMLIKNHDNSSFIKSSSFYKTKRLTDDKLESETTTSESCESLLLLNHRNDDNDTMMNRIEPKENVHDPEFELKPMDRLVRLGETVRFRCKVSGTRPLEVFWFKMNGDELVNNEKYEIYHDDEFYYLKIYNCVQHDTAMYLCVISNEIDQNVNSFYLQTRGLQIIIMN